MNKLTKQNEEDLCKIIIDGSNVHKKIHEYLKDNKLQRSTRARNYIKDLIHRLIDKYKLSEKYCLKRFPSKVPLSDIEFNVIVGGLLGDSWIGLFKNSLNPSGSFTHKIEHLEYVKYKQNLLSRRTTPVVIHNKHDKRSNKNYVQAFCKIVASPVLYPIYSSFYKNGRKTVPEEVVMKLGPLGIAIWFMDDGGACANGYKFSVDCFTDEEIQILQKLLKKYSIESTYENNQNKIIYIGSKSKKAFKDLVEPYMCPCMKYKLICYNEISKIK